MKKNAEKEFYVFIIPADKIKNPNKFVFSSIPGEKNYMQRAAKYWANIENQTNENIRIIKLCMSEDQFKEKFASQNTYCDKKTINLFLENNFYRNPKPLQTICAEKIINHGIFFDKNKVTFAAQEILEDVKKQLKK